MAEFKWSAFAVTTFQNSSDTRGACYCNDTKKIEIFQKEETLRSSIALVSCFPKK